MKSFSNHVSICSFYFLFSLWFTALTHRPVKESFLGSNIASSKTHKAEVHRIPLLIPTTFVPICENNLDPFIAHWKVNAAIGDKTLISNWHHPHVLKMRDMRHTQPLSLRRELSKSKEK